MFTHLWVEILIITRSIAQNRYLKKNDLSFLSTLNHELRVSYSRYKVLLAFYSLKAMNYTHSQVVSVVTF